MNEQTVLPASEPDELDDTLGWVRLYRRVIDSQLWSLSDATFKVAIYLLLSANHKDRFVRNVEIKRGQCVRSLTMISDDCRLSRKAVRFALSKLIKVFYILIDEPFGAQQGHRITICKYGTYQAMHTNEGHSKGTAGAHQGNHEGNTNNNVKNDKNDKEATQGELLIGVSNEQEMSRQGIISRWNAIAKPLGISCISTVTDDRMRRFKAKIKTFPDFWAVVESESKLLDDYVFQKGWFGFDFLIKGDGYVKFKEGKYRKKGIKPDNGLEMYLPDSRPLNEQELEWSRLYGQKTKAAT